MWSKLLMLQSGTDLMRGASQSVARRLGAQKDREIELFGHVADLWVTPRDAWTAQLRA
jgi:hypothetical protein